MVAVLMGDENGLEVIEGFPDLGRPQPELLVTQTIVYQDFCRIGTYKNGVSAAATPQKTEPKHRVLLDMAAPVMGRKLFVYKDIDNA